MVKTRTDRQLQRIKDRQVAKPGEFLCGVSHRRVGCGLRLKVWSVLLPGASTNSLFKKYLKLTSSPLSTIS